ncbi:unnamed protein product [marine sediment metagenome]|uniref:MotA/TolQ/ExbB proton channel domain-containing protein n=1 Tax=marine sediment metagenome TaxID=412755 RepID=X1CW79_9ZZZZ
MDLNLGEVLGIGLSLVFGIIMLIIALGFLPGIFDATSDVLGHGNISDFTGAEESVAAIPTFVALAVMVVGLVLILAPVGIVGYKLMSGRK